jgi:hypothetical protein
MLLGCVHRAKAHALGDLGPGGRKARDFGQLADELQDLGLPVGQGFHGGSLLWLWTAYSESGGVLLCLITV